MAKPIFILKIPALAPEEKRKEIASMIKNELQDYHTIVLGTDVQEAKVEVFYEKDQQEINVEELTEIVRSSLDKNTKKECIDFLNWLDTNTYSQDSQEYRRYKEDGQIKSNLELYNLYEEDLKNKSNETNN